MYQAATEDNFTSSGEDEHIENEHKRKKEKEGERKQYKHP